MKNFKFNAITALIIGVNVAVANAADGNILNITTQDAVNANKTIEATTLKVLDIRLLVSKTKSILFLLLKLKKARVQVPLSVIKMW